MDEPRVTDRAASPVWVRKRRRVRIRGKAITWKWFLVILAAAAIASVMIVAFGGLFDGLEDHAYRPMDIERRYHELQKMKETVQKESLPARDKP